MATFISPTRSIVGTSLGTLYIRLTANPQELIEGVLNAQNGVKDATSGMTKQLVRLGEVAATAFAAVGALSVYEFAKFNQAMTESLSIMGNLSSGMKKQMEDTARSLGDVSVQSATELAKSYYYLASAGLTAEQSLKALPAVARFATAGVFDMEEATQILTDSQAALGMKVKDAAANLENMVRVSDVLVRADQIADASVRQFGEALTNRAAAAMRMFGVSLEEGVAILADFADQGLKGKAAGQALYMILRDLQSAAIKAPNAWKLFGVSVYDSTGDLREMASIVEDLTVLMAGASDEQKRTALTMMGFKDRSLATMLSIMGTSEKLREYQKELSKAGGATKEVADNQLTSFLNQMKIVWHNVQDLAIELGSELAPYLEMLGTKLIEWVKNLISAEQAHQYLSKAIDAVIAIVQAAIDAFKQLGPVVESVYNTWKDWSEYMTRTKSDVAALNATFQTMVDLIKYLVLGLGVIWASLKSVGDILTASLIVQWERLVVIVTTCTRVVGNFISIAQSCVTALAEVGYAVKAAADMIEDFINRRFTSAGVKAGLLVALVKDSFKGITDAVTDAVADSFDAMQEAVDEDTALTASLQKETLTDISQEWERVGDLYKRLFETPTTGSKSTTTAFTSLTASLAVMVAMLSVASAGAEDLNKALTKTGTAASSLTTGSNRISSGIASQQVLDYINKNYTNRYVSEEKSGIAGFNRQTDVIRGNITGSNSAKMNTYQDDIEAERKKLAELQKLGNSEVKLTQEVEKKKQEAIEASNERIRVLQSAQASVLVTMYQDSFDKMATAMEAVAGKQSGAYQSMFAVSKAFAIAKAVIDIQLAIADAFATGATVYDKLANVAVIVSSTASIISNIMSVSLAFQGKARGGPVKLGETYLVGEKGPELFVPENNGTILTNSWLNSARLQARAEGGEVSSDQAYVVGEIGPELYIPSQTGEGLTNGETGSKGKGNVSVVVNNFTDAKATVTQSTTTEGESFQVLIRKVKQDITSELRQGRGKLTRALESSYGLRRGT